MKKRNNKPYELVVGQGKLCTTVIYIEDRVGLLIEEREEPRAKGESIKQIPSDALVILMDNFRGALYFLAGIKEAVEALEQKDVALREDQKAKQGKE